MVWKVPVLRVLAFVDEQLSSFSAKVSGRRMWVCSSTRPPWTFPIWGPLDGLLSSSRRIYGATIFSSCQCTLRIDYPYAWWPVWWIWCIYLSWYGKIMQNPLYFPEIDGSSHPPFIHFTPPFNDTMLFWSGISPHSIGTMRTMGVFLVWGMGLLWIDQHKKIHMKFFNHIEHPVLSILGFILSNIIYTIMNY